jgi:hypothetical protein
MDNKNLLKKAAEQVANATEAVTDGLKSAGQAVAKNITPKPIKAGGKLIIPSPDPSMPPVVVPARRKRRKAKARAAPSSTRKARAKRTAPRKASKARTTKVTTGARKSASKRKAAKSRRH